MTKQKLVFTACLLIAVIVVLLYAIPRFSLDTTNVGSRASSDITKTPQIINGISNEILIKIDDDLKIPTNIKNIPSDWTETKENTSEPVKEIKYKDKSGNEYTYKNDGTFKSFFNGSLYETSSVTTSNPKKITIGQAKSISENLLKQYIPFEKYSLVYEYSDGGRGIYYLTYSRLINGFRSADSAGVTIDDKGKIKDFGVLNIGIFEGKKIPSIDKKQVEEIVKEKVREKGNYKYEIDTMILDINEGNKYDITVSVYLTDQNGITNDETFIIPLED